jgi:hypothetical protein
VEPDLPVTLTHLRGKENTQLTILFHFIEKEILKKAWEIHTIGVLKH